MIARYWGDKTVSGWESNKFLLLQWRFERDILFPAWLYVCRWKYDGEPRVDIGLGPLKISFGICGCWK